MLTLCFLLLALSSTTGSASGDFGPGGGGVLECSESPSVRVEAVDFRIPWSHKEHHFEVSEAPQAIRCTIKSKGKDFVNRQTRFGKYILFNKC